MVQRIKGYLHRPDPAVCTTCVVAQGLRDSTAGHSVNFRRSKTLNPEQGGDDVWVKYEYNGTIYWFAKYDIEVSLN
jgi:hypothetical protein